MAREVVLDDIGGEHEGRRRVTGDVEAFRVAAAPGADVAVGSRTFIWSDASTRFAMTRSLISDVSGCGLVCPTKSATASRHTVPDRGGSFHDDDPYQAAKTQAELTNGNREVRTVTSVGNVRWRPCRRHRAPTQSHTGRGEHRPPEALGSRIIGCAGRIARRFCILALARRRKASRSLTTGGCLC